eukprot:8453116-Lingulodinium_polyedra.AAC.1
MINPKSSALAICLPLRSTKSVIDPPLVIKASYNAPCDAFLFVVSRTITAQQRQMVRHCL